MNPIRAWLAALAALLIAAPAAAQANYPDKPVRFIVGFTPGSATDITARLFAQKFAEAWNVPVTVENVPGAGGSVGGDRVAKSAPDGTTFYWGANGALTINPTLQANPTYDVLRDLAPVVAAAGHGEHPRGQQRRAGQELCRADRARQGAARQAVLCLARRRHAAAHRRRTAQEPRRRRHRPRALSRRGVHRRDRRPRDHDACRTWARSCRWCSEGRLRGLAVTSLKRTSVMPDLPTVAESGLPGFEAISWFGLMAPAGTPAPIIAKAHQQAVAIAAMPDVREKLAALGLDTTADGPDAMAAIIKADIAKWAKVIKDANIKAGE